MGENIASYFNRYKYEMNISIPVIYFFERLVYEFRKT